MTTSRRRTNRRSSNSAGEAERVRVACSASVQDVNAEIDQHIDAGDHQQGALDHRIVPPQHRGDDEVADPGQGKHRFGDDGTTEQSCKGQPDHGQHRGARIPERMLEDHGRRRQALGTRGAHVILLQHIQHAGAREADDQR
jgi:hypothetical protein